VRASITDVARVAAVTPAVVSRVLNGDPTLRVRAATRDRVLAAARDLDYAPSHAARALRRNRTNAFGLAVHDMANPVYGEIIAGAQKAATDAGCVLLLADIEALAGGDESFRGVLHGGAIDGLLLQRAGTAADRKVARAASARVPTVLLNDRSTRLASVALDDAAGTDLATRHLIELGHTRIGHLSVGGTSRSTARTRGWRRALSRAGLAADPRWLADGGHTIALGYDGMRSLLAGLSPADRPSGVVVANVLAAIGALTATRHAGLTVPDDVSLVAIHDVAFAEHLVPPLTTVAMPLRELGAAAVGLLGDLLDGGAIQQVVIREPAPRLVRRGSAAAPGPR
jgi:LacI family transcriptional regulator